MPIKNRPALTPSITPNRGSVRIQMEMTNPGRQMSVVFNMVTELYEYPYNQFQNNFITPQRETPYIFLIYSPPLLQLLAAPKLFPVSIDLSTLDSSYKLSHKRVVFWCYIKRTMFWTQVTMTYSYVLKLLLIYHMNSGILCGSLLALHFRF